MTTPPICMCYPYTSTENTAQDEAFQKAVSSPLLSCVEIASPLAGGGAELMHLSGLTTLPFVLKSSALGLPGLETFELPDVTRGTASHAKVWAPGWLDTITAAMGNMLTLLDNTGLSASCEAVHLLPIQPYIDGEMGYPSENGLDNNTGRNDAALAAAGWTPSGYKGAVVAYAAWLNSHPVMADKVLLVTIFTPGNWPKVNDAGQVVSKVDSTALSADLLAAIEAAYTVGPVVFVDTTFVASPSPFTAELLSKGRKQELTAYQVHATDMTEEKFKAAVKAMPADAWQWQVHPNNTPWVAEAVAALTETPFAA